MRCSAKRMGWCSTGLGVFAAGFDADAAVAVAGEGLESWDVLDALANLTAKSMLVADTTEEGTTRYRMLETMRHYARERLGVQSGEPDHWWSRHADYYADLARVIGEALMGPDEIAWRRRMALELDDLRAAVNWSLDRPEDDRCVQIVAALSVQAAQSDTAGIGAWAERCVERAQAADPPLRTAVLGAAAWRAGRRGDPHAAVAIGLDALRDGLPGWPSSYLPFIALSQAWSLQGRFDEQYAVAAGGHAALDAAGAPLVGHTNLYCAQAWSAQDPEAVRRFADAALANAQACGNPTSLAVGWFTVSIAHLRDEPSRAAAALEQSIAITRSGAGDAVYAPSLALAADLALGSGDAERAIALLDEALRYGRDNGNPATIATAVALGVIIMTDIGQLEVAAVLSGATSRSPMLSAWAVGAASAGELGVALVRSAPYLSQYEDALARLRRELRSPAFDAASAKGAAMSYDQVAFFFVSELTRVGSSIGDT
jgi:tetratricopeptide (TPR) repeat protein